jgi:hypothetical protein
MAVCGEHGEHSKLLGCSNSLRISWKVISRLLRIRDLKPIAMLSLIRCAKTCIRLELKVLEETGWEMLPQPPSSINASW